MPRKPREKSALCIHHVILRGINQQIIFEDEYDYLQFINVLKYYKETCEFKIYAYCLMNNHIHLLIEHMTVDLDLIMKKREVKFVRWYNKKYQRSGYLFQDRYKSEPVNDMRYFRTVFRYIHQNPFHAGMEKTLGMYPWSSYNDYINMDASFVDINTVFDLFQSYDECISYLQVDSDEMCMEYYASSRLSDAEVLKIIARRTSCTSPSDFQRLDLATRNEYLQRLHYSGISIRQMSRLTGISRTAISTAVKKK